MPDPKDPKSPLSPDADQRRREADAKEAQAGRRQDLADPSPLTTRPVTEPALARTGPRKSTLGRASTRHPEIAVDTDDLDVGRAGHIDEKTGFRVATPRQVDEAWEDLPKTGPGSHRATERGYAVVPGEEANAGVLVEPGEYVPAGVAISEQWMKDARPKKSSRNEDDGDDYDETPPTPPPPRSQTEAMISGHPLPHPPEMPSMPQFTKAQLDKMTKAELEGAAQERGIQNISDLSPSELKDALRGV